MSDFDKPIGRVWRRLRFQRFLGALVWSWAGCLLLAALAIGFAKLTARPLLGATWVPFALAGGTGLVLAVIVALTTGPDRLAAAVALDRAFHLNERLSTALTLPDALRGTAAGRALIADAVQHADRLDIGEKFGPRLPRRAWLPMVPALLGVGFLFVPDWTTGKARATSRSRDAASQELVARQAQALSKTIAKSKKELDKAEFAETMKLMAEIEKVAEEMAKSPPEEKGKAMVELNKLTDAVKERQRQLGSAEQMNKQLQQLKDLSDSGPADEFAKDLAKGDFEKAAEQLKKLQDKMAKGELTEPQKKQLQQQLGEMRDQLQKLADLDGRKKQLEEARQNGGLSQQQYEQEMAKLQEQSQNLEKLKKMAQQLAQAESALQQGDMNKAAQAMGMSQQELQELAKQVQELQTLDEALADLQDAKNGMSGDGMNQLGESLNGMNGLGMNNRNGMGNGLGRGRGQGDRPEAPDDVNFHSTKTPQQYGKGKAVITGFAPPKGITKGESLVEIQGELETASEGVAEAMSNQRVPNAIKKHVVGYFDQIRKGE